MALYNPDKARSVLDQNNRGILGDSATQAGQQAYQNAYQAIMGQGPSIGETPDWFQQQRMSFYAPQDINKEATDFYTSTSAQAEDWRSAGQKQYQDFTKQYGADTPWLFRGLSEGGFGADASKYNLLNDPTKEYSFKGDVGSDPYMNARYGVGDARSAYLEGNFNPITGSQGGSFDMFYQQHPGAAPQSQARGLFGNLAPMAMFGPGMAATSYLAGKGYLGEGLQRRNNEMLDKGYGNFERNTTQGQRRTMTDIGADLGLNSTNEDYRNAQRASQTSVGVRSQGPGTPNVRTQFNQYGRPIAEQQPQQQVQQPEYIGNDSAYATRFQNPYRRNQYGY